MNCDTIRAYIESYLDGTLTPLEAQIVEEHIKDCSECKGELKELSALRHGLNHLNDDVTAPDDLMEKAMERIRAEKKRKRGKPIYWVSGSIAAAVCLIIALPLLAGGMGRSSSKAATPMDAPEMYSYSTTESAAAGIANDDDYDTKADYAEEEWAMEEPAPAEEDDIADEETADAGVYGLKIIRTAYIDLNTENYDADMEALKALVAQFGGYITSNQESGSEAYSNAYDYASRWCSLTVRVPVENLDAFTEQAKLVGIVTASGIDETDVTAQYSDTARQLASYQAQYEKVQGFMERAQTVSELMEIESELSRLQRTIEDLQGDLNRWDSHINYSTVSITVNEVKRALSNDPTFGERMRISLQDGWDSFCDGAKDFAVNLYGAIPFIAAWLIGLGIAGLIVWLIVRRIRRKKMR